MSYIIEIIKLGRKMDETKGTEDDSFSIDPIRSVKPVPVDQVSSISPTINPPPQTPEIMPTGFNWGAFWLTWIWGVAHKIWVSLLLIFLSIFLFTVSLITSVLEFIGAGGSSTAYWVVFAVVMIINYSIAYWFGRKGNQWAWARRGQRDLSAFVRREKIWSIVGWVIGIVALLLSINAYASYSQKSVVTECSPGMSFKINGIEQCSQIKETGTETQEDSTGIEPAETETSSVITPQTTSAPTNSKSKTTTSSSIAPSITPTTTPETTTPETTTTPTQSCTPGTSTTASGRISPSITSIGRTTSQQFTLNTLDAASDVTFSFLLQDSSPPVQATNQPSIFTTISGTQPAEYDASKITSTGVQKNSDSTLYYIDFILKPCTKANITVNLTGTDPLLDYLSLNADIGNSTSGFGVLIN